ncbi:nucleolin [Achlya hypogyna]|uniref:Nucleolin n=1 Tax=Achlya hypogyna TaxID=1202772 RepID=A0A1V9ZCR8_ACHHY|nr:nucleolin [Achlya hypogyna]
MLRSLGRRLGRIGAVKVGAPVGFATGTVALPRRAMVLAHFEALRPFSSAVPTNPRIWIGGLPYSTTKDDLVALFKEFGTIEAVDMTSHLDGRPKGTCIITFASGAEAQAALSMDGKVCGTRWMRVRLSEERVVAPNPKPEGCNKVFFANVPFRTTEEDITELFRHCGPITKVMIMRDASTGRSKGFGFIDFETTESTDAAVKLANSYVNGRLMNVNYAPFSTPVRPAPPAKSNTVFIANLPAEVDEDTLRAMFEHCGEIKVVRLPGSGASNYAHISFASSDIAAEAIKLDGSEFDGRRIHVSIAINKPRPVGKRKTPQE